MSGTSLLDASRYHSTGVGQQRPGSSDQYVRKLPTLAVEQASHSIRPVAGLPAPDEDTGLLQDLPALTALTSDNPSETTSLSCFQMNGQREARNLPLSKLAPRRSHPVSQPRKHTLETQFTAIPQYKEAPLDPFLEAPYLNTWRFRRPVSLISNSRSIIVYLTGGVRRILTPSLILFLRQVKRLRRVHFSFPAALA